MVLRAGGPLTRAAGVTELGDAKIGPRGSETNILAPSLQLSSAQQLCVLAENGPQEGRCAFPCQVWTILHQLDRVAMAMRRDNGRAVDPADRGWMEEVLIQRC